jgi:hypothetical protein
MMGYGREIIEQMEIEEAVNCQKEKILLMEAVKCIASSLFTYNEVTHWRMKGGQVIALRDMTTTHLQNTIKMLKRQIDGSLHDEFVYDNMISMQKELERRSKSMKIQNVDLKVVGVTFTNEGTGEKRSDIIRELMEKNPADIKVQLVREPENKYDMNAIKVLADNRQIGYIGKEYATIIAPLLDEYEEFDVKVKGIGEYKNRPYCEITINQL